MTQFNLFDSYHYLLKKKGELTQEQLSRATANFQELYNRAIDEVWRLKAALREAKNNTQATQLRTEIQRLEKEIREYDPEGVSDVRTTNFSGSDSDSPSIVCKA